MSGAVITGLGTVGPFGAGPIKLREALGQGLQLRTAIDRSRGHHRFGSSTGAGQVGAVDFREWLAPAGARRLSVSSRYAVVAARMALTDAGVPARAAGEVATSISLATTFGPVGVTERLLAELVDVGPEMTSPTLFTECVANAPAAQMALMGNVRGPTATLTQREAGPLLALARGSADLRLGRACRALIGSVDEVTPLLHAALDRLGALARPDGDGHEMARPFDRHRDGFLLGEGAAVLVLEREDDASLRGARILARVRTCVRANDPTATPTDWGHGEDVLSRRLVAGLRQAEVEPHEIAVIVSGASGSLRGDQLEAAVLRRTFGDCPLPPVLAPKAVHGEYGGGILAAAVLAVGGTPFGPTPGFDEVDPALGVVPHAGGPLRHTSPALVSGLASGGSSAWVVLERP